MLRGLLGEKNDQMCTILQWWFPPPNSPLGRGPSRAGSLASHGAPASALATYRSLQWEKTYCGFWKIDSLTNLSCREVCRASKGTLRTCRKAQSLSLCGVCTCICVWESVCVASECVCMCKCSLTWFYSLPYPTPALRNTFWNQN